MLFKKFDKVNKISVIYCFYGKINYKKMIMIIREKIKKYACLIVDLANLTVL